MVPEGSFIAILFLFAPPEAVTIPPPLLVCGLSVIALVIILVPRHLLGHMVNVGCWRAHFESLCCLALVLG